MRMAVETLTVTGPPEALVRFATNEPNNHTTNTNTTEETHKDDNANKAKI